MTVLPLTAALLLVPGPILAREAAPAFDHLRVEGSVVETTHGLPLAPEVDGSPTFLGEVPFAESCGGPAFHVSAAAWSDPDRLGVLRSLAAEGYDFDTAMAPKRLFATNPAGTAEVVVSFGLRVDAGGPDGPVPAGVAPRLDAGARAAFLRVGAGG